MMERRKVKIGELEAELFWGDPAEIKAGLREESRRAYLERPLGERLLTALDMVIRVRDGHRS